MNNKFKEINSFNINNKKSQLALYIIFFLLSSIGCGIIFLTNIHKHNNVSIGYIILSVIVFIIIHELIHIIFMFLFSKNKINISFKFPTISVGSNAYFNKIQYIIISLAPVIILGIVNLICFFILSFKFLFAVLLVLNFATATGDYILTYYALKQKRNSFFVDNANNIFVYEKI